MAPPSRTSLPTPTWEQSDGSRGQKRKRVEVPRATQSELDSEDEDEKFKRYYDPNQDPEDRRENKRKSRALEREVMGKLRIQCSARQRLM